MPHRGGWRPQGESAMDLSNPTAVLLAVVSALAFIGVAFKLVAAGLEEVAAGWIIFKKAIRRFNVDK
jgi:hypothetical protein